MKKTRAILLFLGILIGGIFIADATGLWVTESKKVPVKTMMGEYDPGDIRGSYTFGDIEKSFDVSAETLAKAFHIETDASAFQIKELEEMYAHLEVEIGTASVRYFVQLYTGIESQLTETTYLPADAIRLLIEEGKITASHEATHYGIELIPLQGDTIVSEEEHVEPLVKGATTIAEVMSKGYTKEEIAEILGFDTFEKSDIIRDLCTANSLKFSEIKVLFVEKK